MGDEMEDREAKVCHLCGKPIEVGHATATFHQRLGPNKSAFPLVHQGCGARNRPMKSYRRRSW